MDLREKLGRIYPKILEAPSCLITNIHWGDMDAAQHVNNLMYLRWTESGRIELFRAIGIGTNFKDGVGPILGWMDAKYIHPLVYPDHVLITSEVAEILPDRILLRSKVYGATRGKIALVSMQEIIPYDYVNLKKAPIPESWLEGIYKIQPELSSTNGNKAR